MERARARPRTETEHRGQPSRKHTRKEGKGTAAERGPRARTAPGTATGTGAGTGIGAATGPKDRNPQRGDDEVHVRKAAYSEKEACSELIG